MITYIKSADNKTLKLVRQLKKRSVRRHEGLFVAEGMRIVQDALSSNTVEFLVSTEEVVTKQEYYHTSDGGPPRYIVDERLFSALSDTETPQGVLAVCRIPVQKYDLSILDFVIICDQISDPGNLGTIIRTAEAAGAQLVILTKGTVDPFCSKTVRSTMGSIFRVPVIVLDDCFEAVKQHGLSLCVTSPEGACDIYAADFSERLALVIGSEAHGASDIAVNLADIKIQIPMSGGAESLNAAVAMGIAAYEVKRQRMNVER